MLKREVPVTTLLQASNHDILNLANGTNVDQVVTSRVAPNTHASVIGSVFLLCLSDALSRAAMDCTQDCFFVDLPILDDTTTESVGDLLLFAAELVGNDRLRPGHLAISRDESR